MSKIKAVNNMILALPIEVTETKVGGIFVAGSAANTKQLEVMEVGSKVDKSICKRGDKILSVGGIQVTIDSKNYIVLKDDQIICVITP
jgi:co-chaperonin GroES (HSP10)